MSKIAVVCHDAGGAEIISSWLKNNSIKFSAYLEGPATKIFEKKFSNYNYNNNNLGEMIKNSEWLLCGTSWQSDLENIAINISRMHKKKSVSFLDHWVNYKERFAYKNNFSFPDEIWVGDSIAKNIAQNIFSNISIKEMKNEYLIDIQKQLQILEPAIKKSMKLALYVCEPISEPAKIQYDDENYFNYNEESALKFFLNNSELLKINNILLRPHPSETSEKYLWAKSFSPIPLEISNSLDLLEDINQADLVVGCESMAMVIGLMAKKRVISSIPPYGRRCILPHPEIESLDLIVNKTS